MSFVTTKEAMEYNQRVAEFNRARNTIRPGTIGARVLANPQSLIPPVGGHAYSEVNRQHSSVPVPRVPQHGAVHTPDLGLPTPATPVLWEWTFMAPPAVSHMANAPQCVFVDNYSQTDPLPIAMPLLGIDQATQAPQVVDEVSWQSSRSSTSSSMGYSVSQSSVASVFTTPSVEPSASSSTSIRYMTTVNTIHLSGGINTNVVYYF